MQRVSLCKCNNAKRPELLTAALFRKYCSRFLLSGGGWEARPIDWYIIHEDLEDSIL